MLFLGAMHQQESPNYDALKWFVRDVLPLVEQSLGWETRLTVAGYVDPAVSLEAYREHPRITLRGAIVDAVRYHRSLVKASRAGRPAGRGTAALLVTGDVPDRGGLLLHPRQPAGYRRVGGGVL